MKKHFLILVFPFIFLLVLFVLTALRHLEDEKTTDETRTVYVKKTEIGYQLIRNGMPFYIQGAGGNSHFKELSLIKGNTIRLYDTLNLSNVLDEAERYGLAVIADIPLPAYNKKYNTYSNEEENQILKKEIKVFINKYKSHPAILIWNLGNELHYPFLLRKNNFIKTFNELVDIIHSEDPNHPVSTAIAGVSRKAMATIYYHSNKIDLLAFNTFGGTKFTDTHFAQLSFLFGKKPYCFSELGSDGPWEARFTAWSAPIEPTSSKKAEHYRERFKFINEISDPACLGSLIFYWGNKLECTFTWFSLFKDNYKSEIIKEINCLWNHSYKNYRQIGLEYMLVEGKGAFDNIIFSPNELKNSELIFTQNKVDNIRIEWEIYPEALHNDTGKVILETIKPIDTFMSFNKNTVTFITPETEGPYRIFAFVYDQNGYFATTNTPFYVLNTK